MESPFDNLLRNENLFAQVLIEMAKSKVSVFA